MPEKGTLCHAATRLETCVGASLLHGLILGGGGRGVVVEGESLWCVLSGNIVFPCLN